MENIFAHGNVSKVFIKFAIPAILANLLTMSAFFTDGILVGQFIGSEGLAAVNLIFPAFIMIGATGVVVAAGSSALVGRYLGEDNKKEANNVFNLALVLCMIFSVAISGSVLFFVDGITGFLGATGSLYDLTREYFSIILIFFGLILTSFVLEFFIRNVGDSVFPIISTGIASVINVVLTYVFLTVFDMGLAGAAWATGISFTFSIILLSTYFLRKKLSLSYAKPIFKILTIKKILYNGVSESLSEFSFRNCHFDIQFDAVTVHRGNWSGCFCNNLLCIFNDVDGQFWILNVTSANGKLQLWCKNDKKGKRYPQNGNGHFYYCRSCVLSDSFDFW